MSKRRHKRQQNKFPQTFYRQIFKLFQAASRGLIKSLLRSWYRLSRQFCVSQSGFVLPAVTVLLLIMSVVVGSLLFRSFSRTTQVIAEREQQVIYNAATPAIDRAKAKLEFLLMEDPNRPRGLPSDDDLESRLLNNDPETAVDPNPYLLPDETPLDIDGDGDEDAAWSFQLDTNGDGEAETVAYSILLRTVSGSINRTESDRAKAPELVVRNGPMNLSSTTDAACDDISRDLEAGWDPVSSASVRRAFQVTALVVNENEANRTVATLEMQQDRQADRGNKWGAWIRNDLEIFPGGDFKWNGAIHTEGNLIVGDSSNNFRAYLISSPNSCLYTRDNSEITITGNSDGSTPPFLGQMINGSMKFNTYSGSSQFDLHGPNGPSSIFNINENTDSVNGSNSNLPADMSLDPVILFTTDQNQARRGDPNNADVRNDNWKRQGVVTSGRILNSSVAPPSIDDTYRADDRYGPEPRYNDPIDNISIDPFFDDEGNPTGRKIGDRITSSDPAQENLINNNTANVNDLGLDGYWERRAWAEGLRVIVGQRLELGNAYGWGGASDPLYPPDTSVTTSHEQRQWKSLRDNLAAVQSTAVYHHRNSRNFPVACLATTAHPGTRTTITNSTTFNRINSKINTNFLTGNGTNGWEFDPPATSETAFASRIAAGQPLRIALTNLAHFAGDGARDGSSDFSNASKHNGHYGAFPPLQDTTASPAVASAGPRVHPYPFLTMWGDFSNLRRVIQRLDGGTNYNALSIAEKTTLHTASCTLGMLAYNLNNFRDYTYDLNKLSDLNGVLDNRNFGQGAGRGLPANSTPEEYLAAIEALPNTYSNEKATAQSLYSKEQIERDRRLGFAQTFPYRVQYVNNFQYGGVTYNQGNTYGFGCDISEITGNDFFSQGAWLRAWWVSLSDKQEFEKGFIRLAASLCSKKAKYPALFYLIPKVGHFHNGTASSTALATASGATVSQTGLSESYINDTYIFNNSPTSVVDDVNHGYTYKVLQDTNSNGIEDGSENGIRAIAIQPRLRANWRLPNTTTTTNRVNTINDNGTNVAIALLDKGMFNGREMMSVRTLDFDLDLIRRNSINGETWLPNSGVIYAFREDAVREDGIARPRSASWISCDTANEITGSTCRMDAVSSSPKDPPVNPNTGISPKPVDFYADPDRRPHGFRLRNGAYLRRIPAPPTEFALRGMAFISDNPVYIVADSCAFNLHSTTENSNPSCSNVNNNRIEEFTTLLNDNWNNFYDRNNLNANFARAGDTWRPAEIISDAVTILSSNFVDGSIAEGIMRQEVSGRSTSSYRSLNAPDAPNSMNQSWLREDGSPPPNDVNYASPIKISRNGFPLYFRAANPQQEYGRGDSRTYLNFTSGKSLISPSNDVRVNATIISGLVPSRAEQSYGGFHNFPRFIENWNSGPRRNLYISGAFVQLNFSTSATAPFDQDSWEPGNAAQNNELIRYYGAPGRLWGYDVGLQYAPAGPVAERFVTPSNTRSEFYRELPSDDPYVLNLRCAQVSGDRIDPAVDPTSCPS